MKDRKGLSRQSATTRAKLYVAALEHVAAAAREIVKVQPVDVGYIDRELALKQALIALEETIQWSHE